MASVSSHGCLLRKVCQFIKYTSNVRTISTTDHAYRMKARWVAPTLRSFRRINEKLIRDGKEHKIKRSQLPNWNYDIELKTFCYRFNEDFNLDHLRQAMVDESFVQAEHLKRENLGMTETPFSLKNNEELANVGDSIIKKYSRIYLHTVLPLLPTEGISSLVEYLSSEETTAKLGKDIGLKDLILTNDFIPSTSCFSMAFKAVVGALNASSGLESAQHFVKDFVISQLSDKEIIDFWQIEEPLATLQNILAKNGCSPAEPRLIFHGSIGTIEANYGVGIYCDKKIIGKGSGETVSTAIELAALNCLQRIFKIELAREPLPMKYGPTVSSSEVNSQSIKDFKLENIPNIFTC